MENIKLNILIGYDNNGRVVDAGDSIIRTIDTEYFRFAEELYHVYRSNNLEKLGIVSTELDAASKKLIHEKHLISYPYEWPAEMYKDAVLFHLNLFIELDRSGLTLKDAIPSNILFNFTRPVFVDFLSLVKNSDIGNEKWLVDGASFKDKRFAIVDRMLIPFLIKPLLAMYDKNYMLARWMLSAGACNVKATGAEFKGKKHVLRALKTRIKNFILRKQDHKRINELLRSFKKNKQIKFVQYIQSMYEMVSGLNVAPPSSGYSGYYAGKKENLDFTQKENWGEKQRNIYAVLKDEAPGMVIDVGANTGWFSFLAESMGSKVIALDIDEDCVNTIYTMAKKGGNKVLPLLVSFEDLTREIYGKVETAPEYADRDFKSVPLFLAPVNRFRGDLVLCLGLVHHLVLGAGYELSHVFKILSQMAGKSILLEFVAIDDPLIKGEPSFFKNLGKHTESSYNLDLVIKEGKKFFSDAQVFNSHPETRKLILFKK